MAVVGSRVTVGTSAALLASGAGTDTAQGVSALVNNRGAASVDLGGSSVTTGNGYELEAAKSVSIALQPEEELYAVAASGTVSVHVLKVSA